MENKNEFDTLEDEDDDDKIEGINGEINFSNEEVFE